MIRFSIGAATGLVAGVVATLSYFVVLTLLDPDVEA